MQQLPPCTRAQSNQHTVTALTPTVAKQRRRSLPSEGRVQARPQVVVARQGRQGAGRVPIPLVQKRCKGRVHSLGALGASKLLRLKHLRCTGKGKPVNETKRARSPARSAGDCRVLLPDAQGRKRRVF